MSPKSLLRHKKTVTTLEEMAEGSFQVVLDDPKQSDPSIIKKIIICSGKVFYDLSAERDNRNPQT